MKYITFFVLNILISAALIAQPLYLPYRKGSQWGLYDTYKKQMMGSCKYDSVGEASGDLFAFRQNKLWGALNTKGQEVIPAKYEWLQINALQAGNVPLRTKNKGKWGLVAANGKEHLACEYDSIGAFFALDYQGSEKFLTNKYNSDGKYSEIVGKQLNFITCDYAFFGKNNRYGIINKDGKQTILPEYEALVVGIGETVLAKKDKLWGILDFNGREIVQIGYDSIVPVGEYEEQMQYILQYKGKWGLKNKEGHTVIPFDYEEVIAGDVVRVKQNGKWGVIDEKTGKMAVECKYNYIYGNFLRPQVDDDEYESAEDPSYEAVLNELRAKMGNDEYKLNAYLDDEKNQEEIRKMMEAKAEESHKNMTAFADEKYLKVKQNGKMGLITQEGKDVLACEYEDIMVFPYKNKFWVRQNKKWGLVNRKGELLVPYQYDKFYRSSKAEMSGKWVFLEEETGKPAQPCCDYEDIEHVDGRAATYMRVKNKGKWGILDAEKEGKQLIPCEYTKIEQQGDYFKVYKGRKFGYLNLFGKEIFRCEYEDGKDEYSARKEAKYGMFMLNEEGLKVYLPFEYDTLYSASGLEYPEANMIVVKNKKMGFYLDSILTIPCKYDSLSCFSSDYNHIWAKENGKWGLIDLKGKILLPFDYQAVWVEYKHEYEINYPFYAVVKKGGKWGAIIEENGKEVMPFEYQNVIPLKNDSIVWVQKNNLWGMYCLKSKQLILPCQYDSWETWKTENYSSEENPIISADYQETTKIEKMDTRIANYFKVSKKGKWGVVLLESARELIPCKYSQVFVNEEDVFFYDDMQADIKAFRVKVDGKWGWADIFGKEYFE